MGRNSRRRAAAAAAAAAGGGRGAPAGGPGAPAGGPAAPAANAVCHPGEGSSGGGARTRVPRVPKAQYIQELDASYSGDILYVDDAAAAAARVVLANHKVAFDTVKAAVEQIKSARHVLPTQDNVEDIPVFTIPSDLNQDDLRAHYHERRQYNANTFGMSIPAMREDGSTEEIPTTPEKEPSVKERRYFIVELLRASDGARLQFLVEEYSSYVVAFRVLYPSDLNAALVAWMVSGDEDLPKKFSTSVPPIRIRYKCAYKFPERVYYDQHLGDRLFKFFESFRETPLQATSSNGQVFFDTVYIFVAEAPRFAIVQQWATTGAGLIPAGLPKVVKVWYKLSKCVFYLHLYLLERLLSQLVGNPELDLIVLKSAKKVLGKLARAQFKLQDSGIDFLGRVHYVQGGDPVPEDPVVLDQALLSTLLGGTRGLNLLRHNQKACDRILCRLQGYDGPFVFG